jgi:hypothetical protein
MKKQRENTKESEVANAEIAANPVTRGTKR